MMAYLLDTNVLSEFTKPMPSIQVITWLNGARPLFISSITIAEMLFGAYRMPDGNKKTLLIQNIHELIDSEFYGRVLYFDGVSAKLYAKITAHRFNIGKPISVLDAQIASIALAHDLTLVTRNIKDFIAIDGLMVFNPFFDN